MLALDLDKLGALFRSGELELSAGRRPLSADGRRRLFEASPADLATANRRLAIVADALSGNAATTHMVPTSTHNDWCAAGNMPSRRTAGATSGCCPVAVAIVPNGIWETA